MNGCPAAVMAVERDPSLWVITLGGLSAPGGAGFCVTPEACAWEASQPWNGTSQKPASPKCSALPPPAPLGAGGLQSIDCDNNPVFCKASHAMISSCDLGMWLGDGTTTFNGKPNTTKGPDFGQPNGNGTYNGTSKAFPNGQWIKGHTTLNFRGQSILKESIAKLAALGMSKATRVLLTGVVWDGTGVVLNADAIGKLNTSSRRGRQLRAILTAITYSYL